MMFNKHTHTHTLSHTLTHTHSHTLTHTHSHTHTHTHTLTHSHTHTHGFSLVSLVLYHDYPFTGWFRQWVHIYKTVSSFFFKDFMFAKVSNIKESGSPVFINIANKYIVPRP